MWTIAGYTALASMSAQCNTVAMTLEQLILQRYFICGLASTGRMHICPTPCTMMAIAMRRMNIDVLHYIREGAWYRHWRRVNTRGCPDVAAPTRLGLWVASIMLVVCECSLRSCNAFPLAHRKVWTPREWQLLKLFLKLLPGEWFGLLSPECLYPARPGLTPNRPGG